MKLNFNFSGKTLLKDWWKIVRDNFTAIQTDHNELSDKLDTEITQRTNADVGLADKITAETKARESADSSLSSRINNEVTIRQAADNELQRNIDSEITERQTADTNISNSVKAEESARKSADKELKARIDEINANTETTILFGDKKQHTVKFVAPSKPTLYFDGQQEYYGESMAVDITLKDAFYIDGKQIAGTFSEPCINVPIDGVYIVVRYDFSNNMCSISSNSTSVPSAISGDVWTFTLYHINDINLEMKIDSESPTGERYEFISAAVDYVIENENATGDSYFITNTYERVRTLADLATVNKNSFIDAVNENAKNITDVTQNQIFVVCDGDHDELKIQAALSRATRGTVVYIMGDCVLTNENTQDSGLVSGFGHYNAILNVGIRVTLDGTYCSSITFKNTNPAARQVIFFLGIMAKLKNINFQEDNTTCTQTSVNPMILFGNSNAIVDNCVLGEVYDVNQDDSTVGNIIMCSGSKFTNNVIDSWGLKTKTNTGSCMKFSGVFVDNNKFTNIWTTDNSESGYLMSVLSSTFINNVFEDNTVPQGEIYFSGNKSLCYHNIFNSSDIGNITLAGNTANNVFISLDLNERIAVRLRSICNDNTFLGLKVKEGDCAFDLGIESTFANNYIKNLSIITTDSTEGKEYNILYANKAFCRDNVILLSAATNALENLYVIEANASSVVTGNVTSASSIGQLDEGCVAEGNTVAWS
ncbi:hypothetical protein [Hominilimicola sp.]|uniref:hypothetical protein n=1 Tax=Hominilimicola sp. TaxID=3073571 RepID=UPI00399459E8